MLGAVTYLLAVAARPLASPALDNANLVANSCATPATGVASSAHAPAACASYPLDSSALASTLVVTSSAATTVALATLAPVTHDPGAFAALIAATCAVASLAFTLATAACAMAAAAVACAVAATAVTAVLAASAVSLDSIDHGFADFSALAAISAAAAFIHLHSARLACM
jgi:hypothetical protein